MNFIEGFQTDASDCW